MNGFTLETAKTIKTLVRDFSRFTTFFQKRQGKVKITKRLYSQESQMIVDKRMLSLYLLQEHVFHVISEKFYRDCGSCTAFRAHTMIDEEADRNDILLQNITELSELYDIFGCSEQKKLNQWAPWSCIRLNASLWQDLSRTNWTLQFWSVEYCLLFWTSLVTLGNCKCSGSICAL